MKGPNSDFLFLTQGTRPALLQIWENISFKPFLKVNLWSEPIYIVMLSIKILLNMVGNLFIYFLNSKPFLYD